MVETVSFLFQLGHRQVHGQHHRRWLHLPERVSRLHRPTCHYPADWQVSHCFCVLSLCFDCIWKHRFRHPSNTVLCSDVTSPWPKRWVWAWEERRPVQLAPVRLRQWKIWEKLLESMWLSSTVRTRWTFVDSAGFTRVSRTRSRFISSMWAFCLALWLLTAPSHDRRVGHIVQCDASHCGGCTCTYAACSQTSRGRFSKHHPRTIPVVRAPVREEWWFIISCLQVWHSLVLGAVLTSSTVSTCPFCLSPPNRSTSCWWPRRNARALSSSPTATVLLSTRSLGSSSPW